MWILCCYCFCCCVCKHTLDIEKLKDWEAQTKRWGSNKHLPEQRLSNLEKNSFENVDEILLKEKKDLSQKCSTWKTLDQGVSFSRLPLNRGRVSQINCEIYRLPPSPQTQFQQYLSRHGKSWKHASIACGQFWRKLWTFLEKQHFFGSFNPSIAISL